MPKKSNTTDISKVKIINTDASGKVFNNDGTQVLPLEESKFVYNLLVANKKMKV